MQFLRDVWDWFKAALAAVYERDGLVGIAAIVLLVLLVLLVAGYGLHFFGVDVAGWFGS